MQLKVRKKIHSPKYSQIRNKILRKFSHLNTQNLSVELVGWAFYIITTCHNWIFASRSTTSIQLLLYGFKKSKILRFILFKKWFFTSSSLWPVTLRSCVSSQTHTNSNDNSAPFIAILKIKNKKRNIDRRLILLTENFLLSK